MQTDIQCDLPLMLKLFTFCWGGMLTFEMCGTRKFLHQDNFTEIEINDFWWRQRVKNRFEQFDRFRPWLRGRHSLLIRCRYGCATENVWGQPSNWESMGRKESDRDDKRQVRSLLVSPSVRLKAEIWTKGFAGCILSHYWVEKMASIGRRYAPSNCRQDMSWNITWAWAHRFGWCFHAQI